MRQAGSGLKNARSDKEIKPVEIGGERDYATRWRHEERMIGRTDVRRVCISSISSQPFSFGVGRKFQPAWKTRADSTVLTLTPYDERYNVYRHPPQALLVAEAKKFNYQFEKRNNAIQPSMNTTGSPYDALLQMCRTCQKSFAPPYQRMESFI